MPAPVTRLPPWFEDLLLCWIDPWFCGGHRAMVEWLESGRVSAIPSLPPRSHEGDSVKSPLTRDLVLGLSVARLAALLEDKETREKIQQIALDLASREARRMIPGSDSKHPA
jgi:hypothetical protein